MEFYFILFVLLFFDTVYRGIMPYWWTLGPMWTGKFNWNWTGNHVENYFRWLKLPQTVSIWIPSIDSICDSFLSWSNYRNLKIFLHTKHYSHVAAYVIIYRIPNAKSSIAFQLVAVWKDTLAAHWVVVVMSKSINYYSNCAYKKRIQLILTCNSIHFFHFNSIIQIVI